MKVFAVLVLAAAVASAASIPGSGSAAPGVGVGVTPMEAAGFPGAKRLQVFGSPALAARSGDAAAPALDGVLSAEAHGWRSLYDKPFVLAVQQDNKPELAAFLVKGGLASLPHSEDMSFLHSVLRSADDKVGILLSATKFINAPQVEMPITKFFLPKDYTLATSARLHSEHQVFPTMLLLNKADLKGFDMHKLTLIGDFNIHDDAVKVGSDVATPAAILALRKTGDMSIKRLVHPIYAAESTPKLVSPYGYEYIIPGASTISHISPAHAAEIAKYPVLL